MALVITTEELERIRAKAARRYEEARRRGVRFNEQHDGTLDAEIDAALEEMARNANK